ncbi:MAG: 16S rRNA (guanine(966)-N(2))-methyltransferase RsmD [Phototrophicales bacterium]|nr:MAG: 16S rRNA (guanine(966)-N(2))-methyltransferase RsmD [Phototrophicales bacterium]RMG73434.1 MAG: 16S rRNA (guanine(966)-N(2))-methyltransferase RsmD [Chloroflexota bacterium]
MSHRVIAGSAKGRRLKLVPGNTTRPIMDRVKEALFSIIGRRIIDATIFDCFAGTGAVGIEALSRGAKHALFTDMDQYAIKTIHQNLAITRLADRATVRRADVLKVLSGTPHPYDFLYVAPPQYQGLWLQTLQLLDHKPQWIGEEVIVQIDPSEYEPLSLSNLELTDQRQYGKTMLLFLQIKSTPQEKDNG